MPPRTEAVCVCCRQRPVTLEWRPFCSERCRLLDLARWVDGEYRIAGEPAPPEATTPDRTSPTES